MFLSLKFPFSEKKAIACLLTSFKVQEEEQQQHQQFIYPIMQNNR